MAQKSTKVYVEDDRFYLAAYVDIEYEKVDDSFDHEFGTERQWYYVASHVDIYEVRCPESGERIIPTEEMKKAIIEEALKVEY